MSERHSKLEAISKNSSLTSQVAMLQPCQAAMALSCGHTQPLWPLWPDCAIFIPTALFFDEQLVLCNFTPNSAAWQAAVYFLPRVMLRTLNFI